MVNALLDALSRTQHPVKSEVAEMPPLQLLQQRPELADLFNAMSGVAAGAVGMPVDLATMAMRPFGYGTERPVGGSEWVGERLGADPGSKAFVGGTFGSPDPLDAARLAQHFPDLIGAMTVFHGSPHKWDKVDLSKVGTGEGAQAYGHGFYVAENKGIAKSYADDLSKAQGNPLVIRKNGDVFKTGDDLTSEILEAWKFQQQGAKDAGEFPHNAQYYAKKYLEKMPDGGWKDRVAKALDELDGTTSAYEKATGNLYELDLPDETIDKMLDWDKPLSEQPEVVAALEKGGFVEDGDLLTIEGRVPAGSMTGGEVYNTLKLEAHSYPDQTTLPQTDNAAKSVSQFFSQAGIPGIRYLDGTSRNAGEGTRNFVVFDEQYIKPLSRNGQPIK